MRSRDLKQALLNAMAIVMVVLPAYPGEESLSGVTAYRLRRFASLINEVYGADKDVELSGVSGRFWFGPVARAAGLSREDLRAGWSGLLSLSEDMSSGTGEGLPGDLLVLDGWGNPIQLVWNASGFVLYSFGSNGVDEGGNDDDITVDQNLSISGDVGDQFDIGILLSGALVVVCSCGLWLIVRAAIRRRRVSCVGRLP